MIRIFASLFLSLSLMLGIAASSLAQNYEKGLKAYRSGDYSTALQEWQPLAEQGDMTAQYNVGVIYGQGKGVPQDDKMAVKWYRLAAEQGLDRAQFYLGLYYDRGIGLPQDHKEALKWVRLAAEQGYASAQGNLGAMYANVKGCLRIM